LSTGKFLFCIVLIRRDLTGLGYLHVRKRKDLKPTPVEDRVRLIVRTAVPKKQRNEIAQAAHHQGPWLSNWLAKRQDITLDEIVLVTRACHLSLVKILAAVMGESGWSPALVAALRDPRLREITEMLAELGDDSLIELTAQHLRSRLPTWRPHDEPSHEPTPASHTTAPPVPRLRVRGSKES
jgi:hypothetical protein